MHELVGRIPGNPGSCLREIGKETRLRNAESNKSFSLDLPKLITVDDVVTEHSGRSALMCNYSCRLPLRCHEFKNSFMEKLMTNSQKSLVACALLLAISLTVVFGQTRRGYDVSSMDKNTSACTDFYQYANGTWLKNTEIPAAYPSWGAFNVLAENNRKALHEILEEAAKKTSAVKGSNEQKIGDYYASCLDETKREAEGMKPLVSELA